MGEILSNYIDIYEHENDEEMDFAKHVLEELSDFDVFRSLKQGNRK